MNKEKKEKVKKEKVKKEKKKEKKKKENASMYQIISKSNTSHILTRSRC